MEFQTQYKKHQIKGEYFKPDTSETEPGQAQSVEEVLDRCLRDVPPRQKTEALVAMALSGVDLDEPNTSNLIQQFENIDVTQSSDFDLADVSGYQQLAAAIESSKSDDGRSSEQPSQKASEERVLKSDDVATSQPV